MISTQMRYPARSRHLQYNHAIKAKLIGTDNLRKLQPQSSGEPLVEAPRATLEKIPPDRCFVSLINTWIYKTSELPWPLSGGVEIPPTIFNANTRQSEQTSTKLNTDENVALKTPTYKMLLPSMAGQWHVQSAKDVKQHALHANGTPEKSQPDG